MDPQKIKKKILIVIAVVIFFYVRNKKKMTQNSDKKYEDYNNLSLQRSNSKLQGILNELSGRIFNRFNSSKK